VSLHHLAYRQMLPTPNARNAKNGHQQKTHRIQRKQEQGWTIELNDLATLDMLLTPQAQEHDKITGGENQDSLTKRAWVTTGKTSQLNPRFVAEMMGFPPNWTELPFQSGEKDPSKDTETP